MVHKIKSQVSTYAPEDRAVIYAPTVDMVVEIQKSLSNRCVPCAVYSGQFDEDENVKNFAAWREGKALVVAATCAFGQGIDYSSVRHVILIGLPHSLEECSRIYKATAHLLWTLLHRCQELWKH